MMGLRQIKAILSGREQIAGLTHPPVGRTRQRRDARGLLAMKDSSTYGTACWQNLKMAHAIIELDQHVEFNQTTP
jgi:hypothetical protein